MTRILVVYGTTDGHTAKVAREVGIALRNCGADARVMKASRTLAGPEGFSGVIIPASMRGGRYQRPVARWIARHAAALNEIPTAFLSVCLMAKSPAAAPKLAALMSRFTDDCGWRPWISKPVVGALLYTKYNWLTRWVMKRIAAKGGADTDTSRDYDYTDWADLRRFAAEFHRVVAEGRPPLRGAA